jgi:hypothetical protein
MGGTCSQQMAEDVANAFLTTLASSLANEIATSIGG